MGAGPVRLTRIRLTGRGGQGIMLAGAILADAAMRDGRHVTETQEYGPEARLGATKAEVILSDAPIAFPEVGQADILVCLSRDGFLKYGGRIVPGGLRLVEETSVSEEALDRDMCRFPWRERARHLGLELTMNVMAIGTLQAVTGVVSEESLEAVIRERVKAAYVEANLTALREGERLGSGVGGPVVSPEGKRREGSRHGVHDLQ